MSEQPKLGAKESEKAHREYYAQFVLPHVLKIVKKAIGVDTLLKSADPHLNDIPLSKWDAIWMMSNGRGIYIDPGTMVAGLLKEAGEGNSAATGVCILKEAARQIIESNKKP